MARIKSSYPTLLSSIEPVSNLILSKPKLLICVSLPFWPIRTHSKLIAKFAYHLFWREREKHLKLFKWL